MLLEYMFDNSINKEKIRSFDYTKVVDKISSNLSIVELKDTNSWILKFETKNDNEDAAKELSKINEFILKEYSPTVLFNDSAQYFNQRMYPYVNKFERKLRAFIYLKFCVYQKEDKTKMIENIESKDFGEIYEMLFVDVEFCRRLKERVNSKDKGKSGIYTKNDILKEISELEENTLWDKIVGINQLNYIKDNFTDIKAYRNDTMHAHNISYESFTKQLNVFKKANDFLDESIKNSIQSPESLEKSDYSFALLCDAFEQLAYKINSAQPSVVNAVENFSEVISKCLDSLIRQLEIREDNLKDDNDVKENIENEQDTNRETISSESNS